MSKIEEFTAGDGCRIAYRLDGDETLPALVLSNSIATTHRMWDGEIGALSRTYRVLRYDTRGHGGSDGPLGAYSLDRLGRDILELMDELRIEQAHFCGLSLGGFVGQWLGARAPERLHKLVLSNTSPYLGPAAQWDALIADVLDKRDMAAMADMFIGNWFPQTMHRERPDVVANFRRMILQTSPDGLAGCFAVVRDLDLRRSNTLISSPTLVIGGQDDTVTLPSHSDDLSKQIRGAELLIMPGVHMLNVELGEAFIEPVLRFLGQSDS